MSGEAPEGGNGPVGSGSPAGGLLLLAGLALFWGSNWPVMKIVLGEVPVWTFRTICLAGGGAGLLLVARLAGLPIAVPRRDLGPLVICSLFSVAFWHVCSAYGVTLMAAGRASIIAFTMPIWAALLAVPLLNERLTAGTLGGLALGAAGLAVLLGPDAAAVGAAPLGALVMLLSAVSWAIGTVAVKRFTWHLPTAVLTAWMLLVGAVPVAAGALLLGERLPEEGLSNGTLVALAYVLLLPMLFCQWAFITVVRLFPAVVAAIGVLAVPIVGVLSSAVVLGEPVTLRDVAALVLVCAALALVLLPAALRQGQRLDRRS